MEGRLIKKGKAEGEALVSERPLSFLGGIDPKTGEVIDRESDLCGQSVAGKVLVFPHGKGSTVGSYIILWLKKEGANPAAIINESSEPIVSVGAIISDIPMVDKIDISKIRTGDIVSVDDGKVTIKSRK
ncbi:MAG TPA: DUF126 domain-containing protein [Candidatus Methanofastidiosa archaeon]|nr:DUF126 domain-containing protein [Candidatus Methanofastidiosa archaeon]